MAKGNVTLTVDVEIVEQAKALRINMSETISDALRSKIGMMKGDLNNINEELLNLEITRLQNQLAKDSVVLKSKLEQKERINQMRIELEQKRVIEEKELIENMKKCIQCSNIIPEIAKKHKFSKGYVCNACFLSAVKEQMVGWNG